MSIRNLDKIFKPTSVAVVGASDQAPGVGYTLLHNLLTTGFEGQVFAVNPKRDSVQGIPAYANVAALPQAPDLAVIATPARTVPGLLRECGEAGIFGVIVIAVTTMYVRVGAGERQQA